MAQTQIPVGHPLARKIYGAAVFAEMCKAPTFMNRLTGPAPTAKDAAHKLEKMQTSPSYPVIRVTDLSKSAGNSVTVDMFNILQGRPVTGDEKLAGKMMSLTSSSMEVTLNMVRGGVDSGTKLSQQRTLHDLRALAKAGLSGWWARMTDQVKLIHMSGARGSQFTKNWVVPLVTDPLYTSLLVNPVTPPTFDKHFYAGTATSPATLTANDILTLEDIDRLRAVLDDMENPFPPVVLPDDPAAMDEPLYVLAVSHRVWHYLQTRTGPTAWRTFLQNARERGAKNPLFAGEPGMWNGILIKKLPYNIRFAPGEVVTTCQNVADATTTTSTIDASLGGADTANYAVDRCLLMGGQAVAEVWGMNSASGTHMSWHEETSDHGNCHETSIASIGGWAKLRFRDSDNFLRDHGVAVIDAVAPDPQYISIP